MAWEPIETAPKDGAYLWLGRPGFVRLGVWNRDRWVDIEGNGPLPIEPTHWQHVKAPSPPEALAYTLGERREKAYARYAEALRLRREGLTYQRIGEKLGGIGRNRARDMALKGEREERRGHN